MRALLAGPLINLLSGPLSEAHAGPLSDALHFVLLFLLKIIISFQFSCWFAYEIVCLSFHFFIGNFCHTQIETELDIGDVSPSKRRTRRAFFLHGNSNNKWV